MDEHLIFPTIGLIWFAWGLVRLWASEYDAVENAAVSWWLTHGLHADYSDAVTRAEATVDRKVRLARWLLVPAIAATAAIFWTLV